MSGTNYIKKVAVVGATGNLGKHIIKSLLQTNKHEVTALSRRNIDVPEGVKVAVVSYDDPDSLKKALEGQDALVITMAAWVRDAQTKLVEASAAAKVPFVIPNEWGIESTHGTLGIDTLIEQGSAVVRSKIEELGVSSWIAMTTGYWYSHSVALPESYGIDLRSKTVTFFDDGNTKINAITWQKTGEAVAGLLSLPIERETSSTRALSDYKNRRVFVSSWLLSQKDMFKQVLRVTGDKESDWTIKYEPALERWQAAHKRVLAGDYSAFARCLYTRTFFNNGDGDFQTRHGLDNEALGITEDTLESLEEETRNAIKMVEEGYGY
ncbi:putative oxidoreductase CipA [Xylaria sp. CBS 124048]|nr:putative oxidoreductase CipA [Xylaria sp. CBS 124048]